MRAKGCFISLVLCFAAAEARAQVPPVTVDDSVDRAQLDMIRKLLNQRPNFHGMEALPGFTPPLFKEPPVASSGDSGLDRKFVIRYVEGNTWKPLAGEANLEKAQLLKYRLRGYEDSEFPIDTSKEELPVGPTLRIKAGQVLRIHHDNQLPGTFHQPGIDVNDPHDFNRYNFHSHGLDVTPSGNGDNVLLEIFPKEKFQTEIAISKDHISGTFWYHPHVHGSTSMQVSSGMAGALIIDPPDSKSLEHLDNLPTIKKSTEHILLFQQIPIVGENTPDEANAKEVQVVEDFGIVGLNTAWSNGQKEKGWRTTINGQMLPIIDVNGDELQRLRMIHAGFRQELQLVIAPLSQDASEKVEPIPDVFCEIANDGIPFAAPVRRTKIGMYPGYRSDALVKLSYKEGASNIYLLRDDFVAANPLEAMDPEQLGNLVRAPSNLAIIRVNPPKANAEVVDFPQADEFKTLRRPKIPEDEEVTGLKEMAFSIGNGAFQINGASYNPKDEPLKLQLGKVDEWDLTGARNHPFHIHVNPFYITQAPVGNPSLNQWKDTIFVPTGGLKMRTRYSNYIGKFVIHCHILPHEDEGMMQAVEIVNDPYGVATKLYRPFAPPAWGAFDSYRAGRKAVVIFLEDLKCAPCSEQVAAFAAASERFAEANVVLAFVAPQNQPTELPEGYPGTVFYDAALSRYGEYGCTYTYKAKESGKEIDKRGPLHGVYLMNSAGQIFWRDFGSHPYMDIDELLKVIKAAP